MVKKAAKQALVAEAFAGKGDNEGVPIKEWTDDVTHEVSAATASVVACA